jgi:hypothetical protein
MVELPEWVCTEFRNQETYRDAVRAGAQTLLNALKEPEMGRFQGHLACNFDQCLRDARGLNPIPPNVYGELSALGSLSQLISRNGDTFEYDITTYLKRRLLHDALSMLPDDNPVFDIQCRTIQLMANQENRSFIYKLAALGDHAAQAARIRFKWRTMQRADDPFRLFVTVLPTTPWVDAVARQNLSFPNLSFANLCFATALPLVLAQPCLRFEEWYRKEACGPSGTLRKLHWDPMQGRVTLELGLAKGPLEIECVAIQAHILLLFNQKPIWSYQEILDNLQIRESACVDPLISLVHPSVRILCKKPPVPAMQPSDLYALHKTRQLEKGLLKVPVFQIKAARSKPVVEDPLIGQKIERMIIREMKCRKDALSHAELVGRVIVRAAEMFPTLRPTCAQIRRVVLRLIDLEYLERSPLHRDHYLYHP